MSTDPITELQRELASLRAEVAELRSERDDAAARAAEAVLPPAAVTRRHWMKAAAAAAVGGSAVALGGAQPVAAIGPALTLGDRQSVSGRTQVDHTGVGDGVGFLFQSGVTYRADQATRPAALGGYTTDSNKPTGVYGFSSIPGGAGVDGLAGGAGAFGVRGVGARGLRGTGTVYGAEVDGSVAALNLIPNGIVYPFDTTDFHQGGELFVRAASDSGLAVELWYCTVGGTPGSWTQIAGPQLAGSFHPASPVRVYDSRKAQPDPGLLGTGQSREVDISLARDVDTGAAGGTAVPDGARAIAYNVTIVNTSGTGFLEVAPSFSTSINSSTINWNQNNQVVANGSVTTIGTDRKVKVSCGGSGGATNFIIDVTGYWA